MLPKLVVCIPGPWVDRTDFLRAVVALHPRGRYLFAGVILSDTQTQSHVSLEFRLTDPQMDKAFRIAGQGKLPAEVIEEVRRHLSVVYLHFPLDVIEQREQILRFSQVLRHLGGIAVKLESAGIAHTWEQWFELLSGNLFDLYRAAIVLISDESHYYSCGMHHFGLPDCEVPHSLPSEEAATLMNDFNFWQIAECPKLSSGHTFSTSATASRFRLLQLEDARHDGESLFYNPHGVWRLIPI